MTKRKRTLANCTHPVPENDLGITAMHSCSNRPIPKATLKRLFDGPIAAVNDALIEDREAVAEVTP